MAYAALAFLSIEKAEDEELVAIVENDACGVDALQFLTGCTFGKGNLVFRDYGKHVYTLYNRQSKKGVRVVFNWDNVPENIRQDRNRFIDWLLTSHEEDVVSLKEVQIDEPETARIRDSVKCDFCEERVMETRVKKFNDRIACIPCTEKVQAD
jgi:formylmethanofuran dehydrogenase subunit E